MADTYGEQPTHPELPIDGAGAVTTPIRSCAKGHLPLGSEIVCHQCGQPVETFEDPTSAPQSLKTRVQRQRRGVPRSLSSWLVVVGSFALFGSIFRPWESGFMVEAHLGMLFFIFVLVLSILTMVIGVLLLMGRATSSLLVMTWLLAVSDVVAVLVLHRSAAKAVEGGGFTFYGGSAHGATGFWIALAGALAVLAGAALLQISMLSRD